MTNFIKGMVNWQNAGKSQAAVFVNIITKHSIFLYTCIDYVSQE